MAHSPRPTGEASTRSNGTGKNGHSSPFTVRFSSTDDPLLKYFAVGVDLDKFKENYRNFQPYSSTLEEYIRFRVRFYRSMMRCYEMVWKDELAKRGSQSSNNHSNVEHSQEERTLNLDLSNGLTEAQKRMRTRVRKFQYVKLRDHEPPTQLMDDTNEAPNQTS